MGGCKYINGRSRWPYDTTPSLLGIILRIVGSTYYNVVVYVLHINSNFYVLQSYYKFFFQIKTVKYNAIF